MEGYIMNHRLLTLLTIIFGISANAMQLPPYTPKVPKTLIQQVIPHTQQIQTLQQKFAQAQTCSRQPMPQQITARTLLQAPRPVVKNYHTTKGYVLGSAKPITCTSSLSVTGRTRIAEIATQKAVIAATLPAVTAMSPALRSPIAVPAAQTVLLSDAVINSATQVVNCITTQCGEQIGIELVTNAIVYSASALCPEMAPVFLAAKPTIAKTISISVASYRTLVTANKLIAAKPTTSAQDAISNALGESIFKAGIIVNRLGKAELQLDLAHAAGIEIPTIAVGAPAVIDQPVSTTVAKTEEKTASIALAKVEAQPEILAASEAAPADKYINIKSETVAYLDSKILSQEFIKQWTDKSPRFEQGNLILGSIGNNKIGVGLVNDPITSFVNLVKKNPQVLGQYMSEVTAALQNAQNDYISGNLSLLDFSAKIQTASLELRSYANQFANLPLASEAKALADNLDNAIPYHYSFDPAYAQKFNRADLNGEQRRYTQLQTEKKHALTDAKQSLIAQQKVAIEYARASKLYKLGAYFWYGDSYQKLEIARTNLETAIKEYDQASNALSQINDAIKQSEVQQLISQYRDIQQDLAKPNIDATTVQECQKQATNIVNKLRDSNIVFNQGTDTAIDDAIAGTPMPEGPELPPNKNDKESHEETDAASIKESKEVEEFNKTFKVKKTEKTEKLDVEIHKDKPPHIFKNEEGHLPDDNPENRKLLLDTASDPNNYFANKDCRGTSWCEKFLSDGSQLWAQVRNGKIINGGKNQRPIKWDSATGLSKNIKRINL
jgi:hypothetical protein